MRITAVRACQPIADGSPPDWRTSLGQILIAVETDAGLTGYGVGGGGAAGVHVVRTVLRELLIGRETEPVESHWESMYCATLPFGRKGVAVMALSGVDLALWDLRGKAAGRSVLELLGGSREAAIPTYFTVWDAVDAETAAQSQAVKLHVGAGRANGTSQGREQNLSHRRKCSDHEQHTECFVRRSQSSVVEDVARRAETAREAIGPGRGLMIDAWMQWDVDTTLAIAERIAPLEIGWIEEPLSPDDLDGYRALRDACPIPIAGGEHEFTAGGFRPLIEGRLHQIVQPDVCWCGGMTALVKIYRMASDAGVRVVPHRGAELWALPALAALDPQPLAESGRPWMSWVGGQPEIRDGCIRPPAGPGFGVEIDEQALPGGDRWL